jgi:2-pyrone-4,6-dicarboxylate lactonase
VELRDVLLRVRTTAVLDHMAHLDFSRGLSHPACRVALELLGQENWWILLSNGDRSSGQESPWENAIAFGRTMYEAAPDRCIWGTDWPHLAYPKRMPNDAELAELLYRYLPDPQARTRVLVDNPARLYGFA